MTDKASLDIFWLKDESLETARGGSSGRFMKSWERNKLNAEARNLP